MLSNILAEIYARDLDKVQTEIAAYADETDLWQIEGDILNSAGNLCLHICGNLQHFLGAVLGETGYVRDRESEFTRRDVPRTELLDDIAKTRDVVARTLADLSTHELEKTYPIEVFGKHMTTGFFLTHLATHLNWHLGQLNYHRRLIANRLGH